MSRVLERDGGRARALMRGLVTRTRCLAGVIEPRGSPRGPSGGGWSRGGVAWGGSPSRKARGADQPVPQLPGVPAADLQGPLAEAYRAAARVDADLVDVAERDQRRAVDADEPGVRPPLL